jgi:ribosomal protein S18 acetylase RimI-like enzyme
MDIRLLAPGDEALLIRAVEVVEEARLTPERAAAHLADRDLVCVAAVEDAAVAGFVYGYVLRRFGTTSFFIYSVDVEAPFRRRGIARAMLERLKALMPQRGWDEMFVFTNAGNAPAMRLYASAGGVRPNPDDVMFDFYPGSA